MIKEIVEIISQFFDRKLYGEIKITFQAGKITLIEKTEKIKL